MQDINLTAKEGVSEIIVRTGDAPKVHDPLKYSFDGNVSAPLDYFNARKTANVNYFDAKMAVVEVNERGYQIILRRDPKDIFAETVSGQLKKNPDIEAIGVNTGESFKIFIEKLRGKDLACWCKECDLCHADVLIAILESGTDNVADTQSWPDFGSIIAKSVSLQKK